jgi:hypothetical protein
MYGHENEVRRIFGAFTQVGEIVERIKQLMADVAAMKAAASDDNE